ncbi:twin-arginine translocation signal domain-containing protein [Olsenella sp. HMSC062G07]|uniref:sugar ABC transporter substrate-binding protein n=1 Tax=Olsenella sp. HMSC062G07 TaxID=1739330 RepID=UPI0009F26E51|nr:twin-arginine translocation signal domain-containing protein [Olsenella sp. HMSC062G07]
MNVSRRGFVKYAGLMGGMMGTGALAGCSGAGSGGASSSGDKIKIGVSIWSSTDALGKLSVEIIQKAADILGVEISTVDQGHVSEQVTASVETLCAAGCNGIVICNSADSEMTSAINTCNDNQVYLAQFYRMISKDASPDVYKLAEASEYYVGAVHEDEVANGEKLVSLLAADNDDAYEGLVKGARNIKLEAWTVGDATFQLRWQGYKSGVEAWNSAHPDDKVALSDPVYANTSSSEGANVTQQFYNTDPTMDALIVAGGGGDPLVGSVGQLANMGLTGKIRVASTDFLDDLKAQLESGGMYAESGGHFCDPLYAFLMVYAACKGNADFKPTVGTFGREILFPYVYVSSVSEYEDYEKYFVEDAPYTDDEIAKLAEMGFDELNKSATSLSIEDVKTRHA